MQSLNEMHYWMAPLRSCMLCTPRYKQCSAQRAFYRNFVHYVQIQDIPFIHRNCPYRDGTTLEFINIPPQKWSLPLEFINIQPPKRESRSRFRQPKGSPPLDFVNSRRGLPLEFINIHSQKFPFSMRYGRLTKVGYAGWTTAGTAANYQSTLHLCYALILCVFLPFCFVQHFENFRAYLYPQV